MLAVNPAGTHAPPAWVPQVQQASASFHAAARDLQPSDGIFTRLEPGRLDHARSAAAGGAALLDALAAAGTSPTDAPLDRMFARANVDAKAAVDAIARTQDTDVLGLTNTRMQVDMVGQSLDSLVQLSAIL